MFKMRNWTEEGVKNENDQRTLHLAFLIIVRIARGWPWPFLRGS